jgi:hypothetical protein
MLERLKERGLTASPAVLCIWPTKHISHIQVLLLVT